MATDKSNMERINIFSYYKLGSMLRCAVEEGKEATVYSILDIWHAFSWVDEFLKSHPHGVIRSKKAAEKVRDEILSLAQRTAHPDFKFDSNTVAHVALAVDDFEAIFEQECQDELRIFAVSQKGIYDTSRLVGHSESALGDEAVLASLPQEVKTDFNLSGRALAFEMWTATGFHAIRAVEYIARLYFQSVTGRSSEKLNLGTLVGELERQLESEEGTKVSDSRLGLIIAMLRRLNKIYRCPIMHPQMTLTAAEAKQVFDLAAGVIPMIQSDLDSRSKRS